MIRVLLADNHRVLRAGFKLLLNGRFDMQVVGEAADVELISVIQAVMWGEVYVHPTMTKTLLEDVLLLPSTAPAEGWISLKVFSYA